MVSNRQHYGKCTGRHDRGAIGQNQEARGDSELGIEQRQPADPEGTTYNDTGNTDEENGRRQQSPRIPTEETMKGDSTPRE